MQFYRFSFVFHRISWGCAIFWRLFNVVKKATENKKKREKTTVLVPVTCQFIFADKLLQAKCKKWDTTSFCVEQKTEEAESFVLSNKGSYNFYLRISDKCTKLKNKTSMRCPPCLFEKCNQKPKKKNTKKTKTENCRRLGEQRYLWRSAWPDPSRRTQPAFPPRCLSLSLSVPQLESVYLSPSVYN